MNLSRRSPARAGFVYLEAATAASFISARRAMLPIGSAQGGLADLGTGPLTHPPYAFYLTYVIAAWRP